MAKSDKQKLEERLELFHDKDTKNLTVDTPETLGYEYVFHIAQKRQRLLVPNMSRKAAMSENNTIPRVCCSPTLRGCIQGYSAIIDRIHNWIAGDKNKNGDDWKGGLYIHAYKFKAICSPNNKLVFDAKYTDEKWLVAYDPDESEFPVEVVGKIIPLVVRTEPTAGKRPTHFVDCILEVSKIDIPIDEETSLKKGYYQFTYICNENKLTSKIIHVRSVDNKDWETLHKLKTANLSYKESALASMKW